eukprot:m.245342 g.245342  ORF g.245342 m.245342 type:complete len:262 (+) comp33837_c3_seq1:144-929(+)
MFLLLTLLLGSLASTIDAQFQCANSACISTVACNALPVNQSQWTLKYQTIDGLQAVNIVLTDVHSSQTIVNCPNSHQYCHAWGPGFGDRNGVFLINGSTSDSFVIQSWPATKSLPVGPNQTPPGQCLATGSPGGIAQPGIPVEMTPCSETSLRFKLETNGQLSVLSSVPIADPLCLGSPPPPPPPPPHRVKSVKSNQNRVTIKSKFKFLETAHQFFGLLRRIRVIVQFSPGKGVVQTVVVGWSMYTCSMSCMSCMYVCICV